MKDISTRIQNYIDAFDDLVIDFKKDKLLTKCFSFLKFTICFMSNFVKCKCVNTNFLTHNQLSQSCKCYVDL